MMDQPASRQTLSAWQLDAADTVSQLDSNAYSGLGHEQAEQRLASFGANDLPPAPPVPAWRRLLRQFHNTLIYVLLASAVISLLLDHLVDSAVIFAVVLVNALIGFIQEGKAENALRAILSLSETRCTVLRNGKTARIDSKALVPGDIVLLEAGDRVPADLRLLESKNLHCDESLLTGESQAVTKNIGALPADTLLAERKNMAYMGSMITAGTARGIVSATGRNTEIGAISDLVREVNIPATPLQLQLHTFGRQLTAMILLVTAGTMVLGITVHNYSLAEMFRGAIAIAVAAIPEGLPAIVTITLAIGVQRMADKHALVRRLPAVEVLGSVDVICSDKTGTLTANAMTARRLILAGGQYRVEGDAYNPQGNLIEDGANNQPGALRKAARVALLCNNARVEADERQQWQAIGDPTEAALHVLALKAGLSDGDLVARLDSLPFETERRYMATLHAETGTDSQWIAVKGAPDRLLDFCRYQMGENGIETIDLAYWQQQLTVLAAQGMRVMALAQKPHDGGPLAHNHIENDLIMLALVGISDPPRQEAIAAIRDCHSAGIRVKMITGDNPVTATAIGRELGLNAEAVLTGRDIDVMDDAALADAAEQVDIFARTSPENKLQLVRALQKNGHVVAMTGDGVNDAPALRRANIGVAMGQKGTDAARAASDFVLTDDNFATISRAVAEGRTVYDNIVKAILFIMPTSMTEAGVIMMAILLGTTLPITAVQVLWVNMATAITLTLALAFIRAEPEIMQRPPRPAAQGLITPLLLRRLLLVGSCGVFIIFLLFDHYLEKHSLDYARTVAVNTLVMIEMLYLFNCRFLHHSIFSRRFFDGLQPFVMAVVMVLLLQLLFTYWGPSQQVFGTTAISPADWGVIILAASVILWAVEIEKLVVHWLQCRASGKIL
ncbi:MAG TPA: HAD-IC family P-type ATPase [Pseudomonadales bacterium]